MIVAALVLPETTVGMTEASATRRPPKPMHPQFGIDHRHRVAPHLAGAGRVINRAAALPGVIQQLLVAVDCGAGLEFRLDKGLHVRCRQDLPAQLQAVDDRALVGLGREIIRVAPPAASAGSALFSSISPRLSGRS